VAGRDAVEYILKAQGKWKRAVEDYIRREVSLPATPKALTTGSTEVTEETAGRRVPPNGSNWAPGMHPPVACLGRARFATGGFFSYSPCCFREGYACKPGVAGKVSAARPQFRVSSS